MKKKKGGGSYSDQKHLDTFIEKEKGKSREKGGKSQK